MNNGIIIENGYQLDERAGSGLVAALNSAGGEKVKEGINQTERDPARQNVSKANERDRWWLSSGKLGGN